jgi:hypothetical protein
MPSGPLSQADLNCKCPDHKCHITLQKELPTPKKTKKKKKSKKRSFVGDSHHASNTEQIEDKNEEDII